MESQAESGSPGCSGAVAARGRGAKSLIFLGAAIP